MNFPQDLGPANEQTEGAYRRGYHQAIAEVVSMLDARPGTTASELDNWVNGKGMKWRHDMALNRMLVPPPLV
jgi:hypothetical protein